MPSVNVILCKAAQSSLNDEQNIPSTVCHSGKWKSSDRTSIEGNSRDGTSFCTSGKGGSAACGGWLNNSVCATADCSCSSPSPCLGVKLASPPDNERWLTIFVSSTTTGFSIWLLVLLRLLVLHQVTHLQLRN